jgi:hypothetical protein
MNKTGDKMYTKDGTEVSFFKKIDEGYLAYKLYEEFNYDNEEVETITHDELTFFTELFDNPVTEKLAEEVSLLLNRIEALTEQVDNLQQIKRFEEDTLGKVSKFPIVKQLTDYLTGNYSYVLFLKTLEPKDKRLVSAHTNIRTQRTEGEPFALFKLKSNHYSDNDDIPFLVFQTKEELENYSFNILKIKLEKFDPMYNKLKGLKDFFNSIDDCCKAKKDPVIVDIFRSKLKKYEEEETKKAKEEVDKKIEELNKQREKLLNTKL